MRLSSYVDEDGVTVRARRRTRRKFSPVIPSSSDSLPSAPLASRRTAVAPPDGAMCIFTDGPNQAATLVTRCRPIVSRSTLFFLAFFASFFLEFYFFSLSFSPATLPLPLLFSYYLFVH